MSTAVPETNDRGEFTDAAGKLYHLVSSWPSGVEEVNTHEGPWLDCHGCNPPVVVDVADTTAAHGDLWDLRTEYAAAKDASAAAEERLKAVKSKLQTALSEATNGAYRSELRVPGFKPMTLIYTEPWTLDSKRLKAEQPAVYVEYARRSERWTLAESRGQ